MHSTTSTQVPPLVFSLLRAIWTTSDKVSIKFYNKHFSYSSRSQPLSHWVLLVTNRRAGICFLRLAEVPPRLTEVPTPTYQPLRPWPAAPLYIGRVYLNFGHKRYRPKSLWPAVDPHRSPPLRFSCCNYHQTAPMPPLCCLLLPHVATQSTPYCLRSDSKQKICPLKK